MIEIKCTKRQTMKGACCNYGNAPIRPDRDSKWSEKKGLMEGKPDA